MTSAIIVAAGSSSRMGFDKLFVALRGRPALAHAIGAFDACAEIDEILVVGAADSIDRIKGIIDAENFTKIAGVIPGGEQRADSVWFGLQRTSADSDIVAVHDGARPLIAHDDIVRCIGAAREHGAAACARPVADTLKRATAEGFVIDSLDREDVWAMETPQAFARDVLIRACEKTRAENARPTDEVTAVQMLGAPVRLVRSESPNPKLTFPEDLKLAEAILARTE